VNRHSPSEAPADPRRSETFEFTRAEYDRESGLARLGYRFDDGPELVERLAFPGAPWPEEPERQAAFRRALDLLHGIAGVSYYKAGLSPRMQYGPDCGVQRLGVEDFLHTLYCEGLAEFGFVNALDVPSRVRFPATANPAGLRLPEAPELAARALVALGGGKDSLVGLELLRGAGVAVAPACVGAAPLIAETARAAGLPLLQVARELAPELAAMNRAGAWNGHVPVTAINSAVLLCAALLYDFRYVVFSNERSADEATLRLADGRRINHQYSKGSAFESAFRNVVTTRIARGVEYFSVVRPLSELGVVQRFASLSQYHDVYSSCNRNFHLDGPRVSGRWCRNCPKCRFAALSLALFLPPGQVARIQGGDLLDDPAQVEGFRELCELGRDKPFECVGEAGESRAALLALGARPDWREHAVVRALAGDLMRVNVPPLAQLLCPSPRHWVPRPLAERLGLPEADDAAP
jgi:UDP-N-acetyl-alpha-D-muramoyl-L-alanyl-L-glutamate epimerase